MQAGHDGRHVLSAKSVKNVHGLLHKALDQAMRWGLLPSNPCDKVEPPKATKPTIQAAGMKDLQRIIAAVEGLGEWRVPILVALYTGARRGEVLGLQWRDFSPAARTIAVCRALSQYSGAVTVKGTKTERVRVVLLPEELADALTEHAKTTPHKAPDDFIACRPDGRPLSPAQFTKHFAKIAATLEIPITLHGLRHSHAPALIGAGVPVMVVSERLGHANTGITQNVYGHVLPHMQQAAVNALNGLKMGPSEEPG